MGRRFLVLVELIGVEEIVPDAVETTHYGGNRGEEGVAHPYGEHGVLLAHRLSGGDSVVIAQSYFPAEPELHDAAYQGDGDEP